MNLPFPWAHQPNTAALGDPKGLQSRCGDVRGPCTRSRREAPLPARGRAATSVLRLRQQRAPPGQRVAVEHGHVGLPHQRPRPEGGRGPRQGRSGQSWVGAGPQEAGCRQLRLCPREEVGGPRACRAVPSDRTYKTQTQIALLRILGRQPQSEDLCAPDAV